MVLDGKSSQECPGTAEWLVDFNAGQTQLVSFDWSNSTSAIDVKMDGSVFKEK